MSSAMDPNAPTILAETSNIEPVESYSKNRVKRVETLGTLRHRDEHTNEIILIPTPSQDPNDPLNWYAEARSTLHSEC